MSPSAGLEIAAGPDGGIRLTGGNQDGNKDAFLAASLNESYSGETVSQSIHEVSWYMTFAFTGIDTRSLKTQNSGPQLLCW